MFIAIQAGLVTIMIAGIGVAIWGAGGFGPAFRQIAWFSVQISLASAFGYGAVELCKALGFGPDYMSAPKFYQIGMTLGFVFVAAPFTFAVNHYAPILKEKQRAARRRRAEQDFADHVRERGLILAARHQLPRGRD